MACLALLPVLIVAGLGVQRFWFKSRNWASAAGRSYSPPAAGISHAPRWMSSAPRVLKQYRIGSPGRQLSHWHAPARIVLVLPCILEWFRHRDQSATLLAAMPAEYRERNSEGLPAACRNWPRWRDHGWPRWRRSFHLPLGARETDAGISLTGGDLAVSPRHPTVFAGGRLPLSIACSNRGGGVSPPDAANRASAWHSPAGRIVCFVGLFFAWRFSRSCSSRYSSAPSIFEPPRRTALSDVPSVVLDCSCRWC